jgi:hypothetical protein
MREVSAWTRAWRLSSSSFSASRASILRRRSRIALSDARCVDEPAVLGLQVGEPVAQTLVLLQELLGELGALPEELLDERVALLLQVVDRHVGVSGTPAFICHKSSPRSVCQAFRGRARGSKRRGPLSRCREQTRLTRVPCGTEGERAFRVDQVGCGRRGSACRTSRAAAAFASSAAMQVEQIPYISCLWECTSKP